MLASVQKLADKAFVVGFFLPALIAVFVGVHVLGCAPWFSVLCRFDPHKPLEDVTYLALAVWVLAVVLLTVNHGAYRLLEGYVPPISWLGFLNDRHKRRLKELKDKLAAAKSAGDTEEEIDVATTLDERYPGEDDDVLPTSFGNVIAAFETYANDVYGADSVIVWERLQAVIPSSFQQAINDARSQADFYVNLVILSLLLGLGAIAKIVEEAIRHPQSLRCDLPPLLGLIAGGLVVAIAAYYTSMGPLIAWGHTVKSAFDCYLPALGAQLGYELPATESRRREFWDDMTGMFSYREKPPDKRWKLSAPKPPKPPAGGGSGGDGGDG